MSRRYVGDVLYNERVTLIVCDLEILLLIIRVYEG